MVAIATLPRTVASPTTTAPARDRRHVRPGEPGPAGRPALTLVPPARGAASGARAVAGLVAGALLVLAVVLAGAYLATTPTAAPGQAATTHVVAEGETMWSIASEHAPAGEAALYVEELVAANGTASVAAGQTITLPTP